MVDLEVVIVGSTFERTLKRSQCPIRSGTKLFFIQHSGVY